MAMSLFQAAKVMLFREPYKSPAPAMDLLSPMESPWAAFLRAGAEFQTIK